MGKLRTKDDGLGWPKANTKVRVIQGTAYKGQIVYVCEYPPSKRDGIIVSNKENSYHGHFCSEWQELGVIDSLTDDDKQELSNDAWKVAKAAGYCKEGKHVLASLGLPAPVEIETQRLEVQVPKGSLVEVYVSGKKVSYRATSVDTAAAW